MHPTHVRFNVSVLRLAKPPLRRCLAQLCYVALLGCLSLGGCIPRARLAYFQPNTGTATYNPPRPPYKLQAGDVLSVRYSGTDPAALAPFGADAMGQAGANAINALQTFMAGYSVSDSGTIFLPVLGSFRAADATAEEVEARIQSRLNTLVRGAVVKVRLVSFKITVLGEVRNPGTYYNYNEVLTLPEALGLAGDMTDAADRRAVRLVRRRGQQVITHTLDLTDTQVLSGPYFYLQPNDVVYAVPLRQKADRLNLPALSIGLSALSTVLLVITLVR